MDDIEKYMKRVCEKNDITSSKVKEIFATVRGIEQEYADKTMGMNALLSDYLQIMNSFADTLQNADVNTPLDIGALNEQIQSYRDSLMERRLLLDEQFAAALEEALAQYIDPETGEYNWDNIEDALQGNIDDLTDAELLALCLTYLTMSDPEDIEKFVYYGYATPVPAADAYTTGKVTDVFRAVAANTEILVNTTVLYNVMENGDDIANYEDMIIKAQLLKYIVEVIPEANFLFSPTKGIGTTSSYSIGTDENGKLIFKHDGTQVEFDTTLSYILNDYVQGIEDYIEGQRDTIGEALVKVLCNTALSVGIGILISLGGFGIPIVIAGKTVFNALTTGINLIISVGRAAESKYGYDESSGQFMKGIYDIETAQLLGGEAYIIVGPDGIRVVFGANYNTVKNAIYMYGFINGLGKEYGLSSDELMDIILNRGHSENSRFSEEKQAEILNKYSEEWLKSDGPGNYQYDLTEYLNDHPELSDAPANEEGKKQLSDCTPEEIREIIAEYNNSKA